MLCQILVLCGCCVFAGFTFCVGVEFCAEVVKFCVRIKFYPLWESSFFFCIFLQVWSQRGKILCGSQNLCTHHVL